MGAVARIWFDIVGNDDDVHTAIVVMDDVDAGLAWLAGYNSRVSLDLLELGIDDLDTDYVALTFGAFGRIARKANARVNAASDSTVRSARFAKALESSKSFRTVFGMIDHWRAITAKQILACTVTGDKPNVAIPAGLENRLAAFYAAEIAQLAQVG